MDAKRNFLEEKDLCQNDGKRKKVVIPQGAGGSSNDGNVARNFSNIAIVNFNSQENIQHAVIDDSGKGGSSGEGLAPDLSIVVSEFVEVHVKSEEEINKRKEEWKDIFDVNKASNSGTSRVRKNQSHKKRARK